MLTLPDLPEPLLLEVLEYLRPVDLIRCRRVSSLFYQTFTSQDLCYHLILFFFPRSLEGRLTRSLKTTHDDEAARSIQQAKDWATAFAILARRYFNLSKGWYDSITKIPPLKDRELLRPVTPWDRHLKLKLPELSSTGRNIPVHRPDPAWTYCKDQGLLVYPDAEFRYRALDVATRRHFDIPFDTQDKIVRRTRLAHGVLLFEWAQKEPYHELNTQEVVHRHFATAFDVQKHTCRYNIIPDLVPPQHRPDQGGQQQMPAASGEAPSGTSLDVAFRAEWKIHYLGLPLSDEDRFYSAHNSTHYAIYVWQHNRSPYWEDDPLERLLVWDIRSPSTDTPEPPVILRLTNAELTPLGIRQQATPTLHCLSIDHTTVDPHTGCPTGHVFFQGEDHPRFSGPHASSDPSPGHVVTSVGIPLDTHSPFWRSECRQRQGARSCPGPSYPQILRHESPRPDGGSGSPNSDDVFWPGRAPCWRHRLPSAIVWSQILDHLAGVHIVTATNAIHDAIVVDVPPALRARRRRSHERAEWGRLTPSENERHWPLFDFVVRGHEVPFEVEMNSQLIAKGSIHGDERWMIGEGNDGDITIVTF